MTAKGLIGLVCKEILKTNLNHKNEKWTKNLQKQFTKEMCLPKVKYYRDSPKGDIMDTSFMTAIWVILWSSQFPFLLLEWLRLPAICS